MAAAVATNFIYRSCAPLEPYLHISSAQLCFKFTTLFSSNHCCASTSICNINQRGTPRYWMPLTCRASPRSAGLDYGEGVSLGTMKLPLDTDITMFKQLLFQWANSLFQGANLPLPIPLKVDKVEGGVRLGFIKLGKEGEVEVCVYIDCLVSPAMAGSGPMFRAIRNGPLKDQPPPGEPRIMRSLLAALQKSVEIAKI